MDNIDVENIITNIIINNKNSSQIWIINGISGWGKTQLLKNIENKILNITHTFFYDKITTEKNESIFNEIMMNIKSKKNYNLNKICIFIDDYDKITKKLQLFMYKILKWNHNIDIVCTCTKINEIPILIQNNCLIYNLIQNNNIISNTNNNIIYYELYNVLYDNNMHIIKDLCDIYKNNIWLSFLNNFNRTIC